MEDTNETNTAAANAAQIIERLAKQDVRVLVDVKSINRNMYHYAIVPDDMSLKSLDFLDAKAPAHSPDFIDAESFVKYVKDYANAAESRLFANLTGLNLYCVIDYAKKCNVPSEAIDGECRHRANFVLEETEDFKAFREIDGETLEQPEFIAFLMERSHCFSSPDQATILEIATKLEVKSNVNFSGKERSNDGGINLTYREDVDARVGTAGKIKVPDFVELELQAFEGGEKMKLRARFYFKLSGGAVLFQVKILNLRETILKNFREVCDKIAEDTGLPIHYTK